MSVISAENPPATTPRARAVGAIVLLGPPGVGKGTQAKILSAHFGVAHISTGDILRENRERGTALGLEAAAIMDRGQLVPDALIYGMVSARLAQPDCARGAILDGFPRTVTQAQWLDRLLADPSVRWAKPAAAEARRALVLQLQVEYNELLRRLSGRRSCPTCGRIYNVYFQPPRRDELCDVDGARLSARKDDSEEVIAERLKAYAHETQPVAEFYRRSGRLREINGQQPVERVTEDLLAAIEA